MKIKIEIPMTDFMAVKDLVPAMGLKTFQDGINAIKGVFEKAHKGMVVKTTFSLMLGFQFVFEGSMKDMIQLMEDELEVKLKIYIDAVASASMLIYSGIKTANEVWKEEHPKQEVAG